MVDEISLSHSLCSAMPPPGYNRQRRHVLVLTLPNGGTYFFQAGTEDLVMEWVLTCNYWAGRMSKEPLMGGLSNMDHGWNRVLPGGAADGQEQEVEDLASVRSGMSGHSQRSRLSYAGSIGRHSSLNVAGPTSDRTHLYDWQPVQPPSVASNLCEDAQLESLKRHTIALKQELEKHNDLRTPMMRLVSLTLLKSNTKVSFSVCAPFGQCSQSFVELGEEIDILAC